MRPPAPPPPPVPPPLLLLLSPVLLLPSAPVLLPCRRHRRRCWAKGRTCSQGTAAVPSFFRARSNLPPRCSCTTCPTSKPCPSPWPPMPTSCCCAREDARGPAWGAAVSRCLGLEALEPPHPPCACQGGSPQPSSQLHGELDDIQPPTHPQPPPPVQARCPLSRSAGNLLLQHPPRRPPRRRRRHQSRAGASDSGRAVRRRRCAWALGCMCVGPGASDSGRVVKGGGGVRGGEGARVRVGAFIGGCRPCVLKGQGAGVTQPACLLLCPPPGPCRRSVFYHPPTHPPTPVQLLFHRARARPRSAQRLGGGGEHVYIMIMMIMYSKWRWRAYIMYSHKFCRSCDPLVSLSCVLDSLPLPCTHPTTDRTPRPL